MTYEFSQAYCNAYNYRHSRFFVYRSIESEFGSELLQMLNEITGDQILVEPEDLAEWIESGLCQEVD